jgi:hypothetical protein
MEIEKDLERLLVPLFLIERIVKIKTNIGKEAARGHVECLSQWLAFTEKEGRYK